GKPMLHPEQLPGRGRRAARAATRQSQHPWNGSRSLSCRPGAQRGGQDQRRAREEPHARHAPASPNALGGDVDRDAVIVEHDDDVACNGKTSRVCDCTTETVSASRMFMTSWEE